MKIKLFSVLVLMGLFMVSCGGGIGLKPTTAYTQLPLNILSLPLTTPNSSELNGVTVDLGSILPGSQLLIKMDTNYFTFPYKATGITPTLALSPVLVSRGMGLCTWVEYQYDMHIPRSDPLRRYSQYLMFYADEFSKQGLEISNIIGLSKTVKPGDTWEMVTRLYTKNLGVMEWGAGFVFLVDRYKFDGIVETGGKRYAIISSLQQTLYVYFANNKDEGSCSRSYVNRGTARYAYDYNSKTCVEFDYTGGLRIGVYGSLLAPLGYLDESTLAGLDPAIVEDYRHNVRTGNIGAALTSGGGGGAIGLAGSIMQISAMSKNKKIVNTVMDHLRSLNDNQIGSVVSNAYTAQLYSVGYKTPVEYYVLYKAGGLE